MENRLNKIIKIIKNNIFGFIVGSLLFGGIGVCAAAIASSSVAYDNKNSGSPANNVKEALDDLYVMADDGKEKIANAITNKGVETSKEDSFDTMASNINNILGGDYDLSKLRESLAYSGLGITDETSYEEICEILQKTYPKYLDVTASKTWTAIKNGSETWATYDTPETYQLTGFTKVVLSYSAKASYYHDENGPHVNIALYNSTTGIEYSLTGSVKMGAGSVYSVTDKTITLPTLPPGDYKIRLKINWWNNYDAYISITKMHFS